LDRATVFALLLVTALLVTALLVAVLLVAVLLVDRGRGRIGGRL